MAYLSTNEFPGTGAIMQVEINFAGNRPGAGSGVNPYFNVADVKALRIVPPSTTSVGSETAVALTAVNANTFRTAVAIPLGQTLRVYRESQDEYGLVDFQALQLVTEDNLDTLAKQTLFVAMEAKDSAAIAGNKANAAVAFAVTSNNTAGAAVTTAGAAVVTANSAAAVSAGANAKSDQAVATSNSAANVANLANQASLAAVAAAEAAIDAIGNTIADVTEIVNEATGRFLDPRATNPTTRDDGSALVTGDRYLNTVSGVEFIYKSGAWAANNVDGADIANAGDPSKGASLVGFNGESVRSALNKVLPAAIATYGVKKSASDSTVEAQATAATMLNSGGGAMSVEPGTIITGPLLQNKLTPTLVRSSRAARMVVDGSDAAPSTSDQPAGWFQKVVAFDSGSDRYWLSPGALFAEVIANGSNSSGNTNDGSWAGLIANARMKNKNVGTASSPITDAVGSLTGVAAFSKADFFPGNGTAQTALWGYASTITATDVEYDALAAAGYGWATVGCEINIQIDHKDGGYRENIAGADTVIGHWVHNYLSKAGEKRNFHFGMAIDGAPLDNNPANLDPANWQGHYVGVKIDDVETYGILQGRRNKAGSTFIKGAATHTLVSGGVVQRPRAILDTGDNQIIFTSFTGVASENGAMWANGGSLWFRKSAVNYDVLLNGERSYFGSITNQQNRLEFYGAPTGGAVAIVAGGSDANRDIELRPGGSGLLWCGSAFQATTVTSTGYVRMKTKTGQIVRLLGVLE